MGATRHTPIHSVSLAGNTAGALALISSGTMTLAGGNAITLSQAGNAVTIVGPSLTESQTFIAGISASDTLYSSGTVRFTGSQAVTVRSGTGQLVVIDAPAQSVQPETQTFVAGVANSQTTYTSGTVSLSELGAITIRSSTGQHFQFEVPATSSLSATGIVSISTNGSTISIGAPAGAAQTAISGISASDTLYTSGTVRITGVGGGVTVSSNTGQRVDISVAAQSVQPETQTFIAGVSASDTLYTSGNVRFTGVGGGVTVSSNTGQRVDISVAAQSVQAETQTFIAGVSASDTLYTSGNVRITGVGGGITVSSNTGQRVDLSVAAQSVQTQNMVAVTLSGNTSGAQALISSGTLTLAGGNNITVSQAGNAITISGGAGGAETQTAISGIANSETTYTSGTVSLSELGAITILSTTGQIFQLSVNAQSVQPETQTFIAGVSASDTLYTSGNVRITGVGGGVTVSSNTGQRVDISVAAQSVQAETQTFIAGVSASDTLYTSGNVRFTGSQAVTVRSGTGQLVVIDAPAQTTQVETQTFVGGVVGSNATYTSGTVTITGVGGGITVSSNTGQRIDLSVAAPVAQTNQAGSVYAASNTSGTSSGTYDARTLSIAGMGMITVAASNSGWRINATQSVQTQQNVQALYDGANSISSGTVSLANANGVTFSNNAQTLSASVNQSISMFAVSNTTQSTSGTAHKSALSFGGAGVASVGVTGGSVVISVPAGGGAAFSGGVSTGGNTAGATGITGTQNVFVGSGVVSLSQTTGANGGTISILAPATSSLSATGAVEISTNGSTISIGAPAIKTLADLQNFPQGEAVLLTNIAGISKTPFYFNMNLPGRITANSFVWKVSQVTANTLNSLSAHIGIYTAVNSTSMALLGSWSETYVVSSASSVSFSGVRHYVASGIGTHTALSVLQGGDYGIGMMFSAGASQSMNMSLMGANTANGPLGLIRPGVNQLSAGTSQGAMALWGRGSTTVNAMPANVVASELVNQGSGASVQLHPWIYIRS